MSFNLSPVGLSGCGTITLGGAYVDTHGIVYGIKVRVYEIHAGELVTGRVSLDSSIPKPCSYEKSIENPQASTLSEPSRFDALNFYVPAGSYRVVVTLYADKTCSYEIGYWSDYVIVEPANVSQNLDIFIKSLNDSAWD